MVGYAFSRDGSIRRTPYTAVLVCRYVAVSAVKVTHFLELVTVTVTFPKKELVTGKSYT
jgi:hypothetical protein